MKNKILLAIAILSLQPSVKAQTTTTELCRHGIELVSMATGYGAAFLGLHYEARRARRILKEETYDAYMEKYENNRWVDARSIGYLLSVPIVAITVHNLLIKAASL